MIKVGAVVIAVAATAVAGWIAYDVITMARARNPAGGVKGTWNENTRQCACPADFSLCHTDHPHGECTAANRGTNAHTHYFHYGWTGTAACLCFANPAGYRCGC